jgi:hypothetical protein
MAVLQFPMCWTNEMKMGVSSTFMSTHFKVLLKEYEKTGQPASVMMDEWVDRVERELDVQGGSPRDNKQAALTLAAMLAYPSECMGYKWAITAMCRMRSEEHIRAVWRLPEDPVSCRAVAVSCWSEFIHGSKSNTGGFYPTCITEIIESVIACFGVEILN